MMRQLLPAAFAGMLLALLFSCSNSEPSVLSVTGTVVFDFADEENPPATRLALFLQTDTEAQRSEEIRAVHTETGLSWQVTNPRIISGSGKNWTGYTNLQPAPGEPIATGTYDCRYTDAAGNEASAKVTVQYPEALLEARAATAKDCIQAAVVEYIALYSETDELMFFNKRRNGWRSNNDIAKDYRNAYTLRRCLVTGNNGIVFLLPPESLKAPADTEGGEKESTEE